jgi:hypothetical protein
MSNKLTLNTVAMLEEFFADTALIGIVSPLPGYRFCWMLNQQMDTNFVREPEMDVCLQKSQGQEHYFPIYQYYNPLSRTKYLLYKLKSEKESLLPEVKQLDYLWMIQSSNSEHDAQSITQHLRHIPDVQLAQILSPEKLKSLAHLVV